LSSHAEFQEIQTWADDPLEDLSEDLFDRSHFADMIAKALLAKNEKRATIIGLTGPWGSGKSTIANFAVSNVKDQAITMIFEPWMVNNTEALVKEFFVELGKCVSSSKEVAPPELRKKLYSYSAQCMVALALSADALEMIGVPHARKAAWGFKGVQKALDAASKGLEKFEKTNTLREARQELSIELSKLETPIVIVVDDIDRLNSDEVRAVFQLIKACADFPNLRYLIPYDPAQVHHALKEVIIDPAAFIEKIVTHPFDVPEITTKQQEQLVHSYMGSFNVNGLSDKQQVRLVRVLDEVLVPGLTSARQIKRFFRTSAAILPSLVIDNNWNVDLADFLALEYIRQNLPELYRCLRNENSPNPGGQVARMVSYGELNEANEKARSEALAQSSDPRTGKLCSHALEILASDISDSNEIRGQWSPLHHSERRFYSRHYKPVYLGFAAARAAISESEWVRLLEELDSKGESRWFIEEIDDPRRLHSWSEVISGRARELSVKNATTLTAMLLAWGERQGTFNPKDGGLVSDWAYNCHLICSSCMRVVARLNKASAMPTLLEILRYSDTLVAPASFLATEWLLASRTDPDWCSRNELSEVTSNYSRSLAELLYSGSIWALPDPFQAFEAWTKLSGDSEYSSWLERLRSDSNAAINYFNYVLGPEHRGRIRLGVKLAADSPIVQSVVHLIPELLNPDGQHALKLVIDKLKASEPDPLDE